MNRYKTKLIGFTLILLAVFFTQSCSHKDVFKISSTLDLTGSSAAYGNQCKDGINLAVDEINAKGGINGKKVELTLLDSKGDANQAVTNLNKFLSVDGSKFIIGEISSTATLAMIPVVDKTGGFLFSPVSSSYKLSNISPNFARNWPADNAEAGYAANFASNILKAHTAVVVHSNNDYGIGLKEAFVNTFSKEGGEIVAVEPFEVNTSDFKTLITKLQGLKVDCIYLTGNAKEMGMLMKQYGDLKLNTPIISNSSFSQPQCYKVAGAGAEGVIIPTPAYTPNDSNNINALQFFSNFKAKYNREPTITDANGYDAVELICEAISKFGYDPQKAAAYIRNLKDYKGVAGKLDFTNGDVQRTIVYKTIKNGTLINYQ